MYVPQSVVYHKYGGISGKFRHAPLRVFYGTRNSLFNITKNYESHNIPLYFFFTLLHHIFKTLYFLIRLKVNIALLMIKAYVSFLRLLPRTIGKRKEIQKRRKVSDGYLFDNSLIVTFADSLKEFLRLLKV